MFVFIFFCPKESKILSAYATEKLNSLCLDNKDSIVSYDKECGVGRALGLANSEHH